MKSVLFALAAGMSLAFTANGRAQEPVDAAVVTRSAIATPQKVCVTESQPTKKTVYNVVCKDFCVKHSFHLFGHGWCDLCGDEPGGGNCELHTKKVLVKKIVPGPCAEKCVLKDAPAPVFEKIALPKK